nr:hypothetical protein [Candidatus Sigynarchaeum springense]
MKSRTTIPVIKNDSTEERFARPDSTRSSSRSRGAIGRDRTPAWITISPRPIINWQETMTHKNKGKCNS